MCDDEAGVGFMPRSSEASETKESQSEQLNNRVCGYTKQEALIALTFLQLPFEDYYSYVIRVKRCYTLELE